jgi:hypothetical protein
MSQEHSVTHVSGRSKLKIKRIFSGVWSRWQTHPQSGSISEAAQGISGVESRLCRALRARVKNEPFLQGAIIHIDQNRYSSARR